MIKLFFIIPFLIPNTSFTKKTCTLNMSGEVIARISAEISRTTIIEFISKPKKTKPGSNDFDFEYIENDLAITPKKYPAHTNVFIYLEGKRYGFDIKATTRSKCDHYRIKPVGEKLIEVNWYE